MHECLMTVLKEVYKIKSQQLVVAGVLQHCKWPVTLPADCCVIILLFIAITYCLPPKVSIYIIYIIYE